MRRVTFCAGLALLAAAGLIAAPSQRQPFFPIDDVRPGLVGIGTYRVCRRDHRGVSRQHHRRPPQRARAAPGSHPGQARRRPAGHDGRDSGHERKPGLYRRQARRRGVVRAGLLSARADRWHHAHRGNDRRRRWHGRPNGGRSHGDVARRARRGVRPARTHRSARAFPAGNPFARSADRRSGHACGSGATAAADRRRNGHERVRRVGGPRASTGALGERRRRSGSAAGPEHRGDRPAAGRSGGDEPDSR